MPLTCRVVTWKRWAVMWPGVVYGLHVFTLLAACDWGVSNVRQAAALKGPNRMLSRSSNQLRNQLIFLWAGLFFLRLRVSWCRVLAAVLFRPLYGYPIFRLFLWYFSLLIFSVHSLSFFKIIMHNQACHALKKVSFLVHDLFQLMNTGMI